MPYRNALVLCIMLDPSVEPRAEHPRTSESANTVTASLPDNVEHVRAKAHAFECAFNYIFPNFSVRMTMGVLS